MSTKPRRTPLGKWHMTSGWPERGNIYPIGYCRDHEGHDTAEEAAECYRRYEADNLRPWTQVVPICAECGCQTDGGLESDHRLVELCTEHRTREMWLKHTEPIVEAVRG